jgi:hypothetical protein
MPRLDFSDIARELHDADTDFVELQFAAHVLGQSAEHRARMFKTLAEAGGFDPEVAERVLGRPGRHAELIAVAERIFRKLAGREAELPHLAAA